MSITRRAGRPAGYATIGQPAVTDRTPPNDAGADDAGLSARLVLHPDLVTLDRSLIHDLDADPAGIA